MPDQLENMCDELISEFAYETGSTGVNDSQEPASRIWANLDNLTAGWRRTHDDCTVEWLEQMKELFYSTNRGTPIPNTILIFDKYFSECMQLSQSPLSEKYKI